MVKRPPISECVQLAEIVRHGPAKGLFRRNCAVTPITRTPGHLEKTCDLSGFRAVDGSGLAMAAQPGFIDGEKRLTVPARIKLVWQPGCGPDFAEFTRDLAPGRAGILSDVHFTE